MIPSLLFKSQGLITGAQSIISNLSLMSRPVEPNKVSFFLRWLPISDNHEEYQQRLRLYRKSRQCIDIFCKVFNIPSPESDASELLPSLHETSAEMRSSSVLTERGYAQAVTGEGYCPPESVRVVGKQYERPIRRNEISAVVYLVVWFLRMIERRRGEEVAESMQRIRVIADFRVFLFVVLVFVLWIFF
ncbi:hypothetical protein GEMRC1_002395 [Eukaryota sp. GEM-RC1]